MLVGSQLEIGNRPALVSTDISADYSKKCSVEPTLHLAKQLLAFVIKRSCKLLRMKWNGAVEVELDWVVLVAGLTAKSGDDERRPSLNKLRREFIPSG